MNVVFLNLEGVLLHKGHPVKSTIHAGTEFCPVSVRRLKELLTYTRSKIVVTSVWRIGETVETFNLRYLQHYGLESFLVGFTPLTISTAWKRGKQIQAYLDAVKATDLAVNKFVILDVNTDMYHLIHRLVQCTEDSGLTEEVKAKALKLMLE